MPRAIPDIDIVFTSPEPNKDLQDVLAVAFVLTDLTIRNTYLTHVARIENDYAGTAIISR